MWLGSVCTFFAIVSASHASVIVHSKKPVHRDLKGFCPTLPEEHMNVSQMITYHGYPCEDHEVITKDGYILSLQHIPHGVKNKSTGKKEVVFLQHGLIDSSATWVNNLPLQSLGFVLADHGFDVWLGNSRGNTYSNKHVNMTTSDAKFWDFSFDEMAKFDLPALVDYVIKYTGQSQLHYVGHSQGTLIGFAEFGRNQVLAEKIKRFYALAPVAAVGHIKGALKVLSYFTSEIEFLFKLLGIKEFLPSDWLMKFLADVVCSTHWTEKYCGDIIFLLAGFDTSNLNYTRIPIYISHTPAGTSVKDIIHFAQMVKSGKFQMYDYGEEGNTKIYKQKTAPLYDVSLMRTPVALYTGTDDWLSDPYDVNTNLRPYLKNIVYSKNVAGWNHMDFVWGEDAHNVIYKDMIKLMET